MSGVKELPEHFTKHTLEGAGTFWIATPLHNDDTYVRELREGWHVHDPTVKYVVDRLRPGDRFGDIGANLGTFAIPAAMKQARVLAVEALPDNFVYLCRSAAKNGLTNLLPVHCAAYDRPGIVSLSNNSAWGTVTNDPAGIPTPALPLEELFAIHGFREIDILKIDIEGSELPALRGLHAMLSAGKIREIVFELNESACRNAGYSGDELLRFIENFGYHFYQFYGGGCLSPFSTGDFRELYCNNYLASRSELSGEHGGLLVAPAPREWVLAYALEQATSQHEVCRAHIAEEMHRAPADIRENAKLKDAVAALEHDSSPRVVAAWRAGRK